MQVLKCRLGGLRMTQNDIIAIEEYMVAAADGNLYIDYIADVAKKAKLVLEAKLSENLLDRAVYKKWLIDACEKKDNKRLEYMFILGFVFEHYDDEVIEILGKIACDDWHSHVENLLHLFEKYPTSFTKDILCKMVYERYPNQNYGKENNENITRKVIWVLWRLKEYGAVKELSQCDDVIVAKYAKRQLTAIKR